MSQQSVSVNEPEEGDDGALHELWTLPEEDRRALLVILVAINKLSPRAKEWLLQRTRP